MGWSCGRILGVHLKPEGATYTGTFENFVAPKSLRGPGPNATLNVTDLEFGKDGAMYFLTGGRGTQSGLYRVTYSEPTPAAAGEKFPPPDAEEARRLRPPLQKIYGQQDARANAF